MPIPNSMAEAADLLGVGIDADAGAIRDRYRRLARVFHPDQNQTTRQPASDARNQRRGRAAARGRRADR